MLGRCVCRDVWRTHEAGHTGHVHDVTRAAFEHGRQHRLRRMHGCHQMHRDHPLKQRGVAPEERSRFRGASVVHENVDRAQRSRRGGAGTDQRLAIGYIGDNHRVRPWQ